MVIGRGLIGHALAAALRDHRIGVTTVARSEYDRQKHHLPLDLNDPRDRKALQKALIRQRPRSVVLTHGPSDVTWCETNPEAALSMHEGVAAAVAETDVPAVLVSTDNLFDGSRPFATLATPIRPANAYGRAKAAAEAALTGMPIAAVVRTSLVYGWSGPSHRDNFAERCLYEAYNGKTFSAPLDQYFTPVFVGDVATVLAAIAERPAEAPRVSHLAGPEQLSRHAFAQLAYLAAGADPRLVRAVKRAETAWASRPEYSSLAPSEFRKLPGLSGYRPQDPRQGLARMVQRNPSTPHSIRKASA